MLLAVTGGAPASQGAIAWTGCQLGTPWPLPPIARIPARPGDGATAPWCRIVSGRRSCVPRASWVVRENRRPGTSSWCIPIDAPDDIHAYADRVSAVAGESVDLFVSTSAGGYRVHAYRLGYYQGLGAREVLRSGRLLGQDQRVPAPSGDGTNLVEARWRPTLRFDVTGAWPPGVPAEAGGLRRRAVLRPAGDPRRPERSRDPAPGERDHVG